jgi:hypothetical protein
MTGHSLDAVLLFQLTVVPFVRTPLDIKQGKPFDWVLTFGKINDQRVR